MTLPTDNGKTPEASNEELLRKVIEAQVKGGCNKFAMLLKGKWCSQEESENQEVDTDDMWFIDTDSTYSPNVETVKKDTWAECQEFECSVLRLLLDTDGLRAAYGEDTNDGMTEIKPNATVGFITPSWTYVFHKILDAWHSGKGNNLRAALECAVDLLP